MGFNRAGIRLAHGRGFGAPGAGEEGSEGEVVKIGYIREPKGNISVETRRESFYIHDYNDDIFPLTHDPEIHYRALDDLLSALKEMMENDLNYTEWKARNKGRAK